MNPYRQDFPILHRDLGGGKKLVYLDSAATSQKPEAVLQAMDTYYRGYNANIHRGIYQIAEEATAAYEEARKKVAAFINAGSSREIVFTSNTTESINLVAHSWARKQLKAGDLIILTEMEHHANLVPWHILAEEKGLRLEFIPMLPDGTLDLDSYRTLLTQEPKLVSFAQMSNVLGTVNPANLICDLAHQAGAKVLIDGAQSVPHFKVDVQDMQPDFLAFSAHKMCGPTGIGALYAPEAMLQSMSPFMGGGDMIRKVELRSFVPNEIPYKFEAGTPPIAEAIGFGAAIDYLSRIGIERVHQIEQDVTAYAIDKLKEIPQFQLLGPGLDSRGGVLSMVSDIAHPHDIAQILDSRGVAVRAGHHCAMPLHTCFKIQASTRASFYIYNDIEEVDILMDALREVVRIFG